MWLWVRRPLCFLLVSLHWLLPAIMNKLRIDNNRDNAQKCMHPHSTFGWNICRFLFIWDMFNVPRNLQSLITYCHLIVFLYTLYIHWHVYWADIVIVIQSWPIASLRRNPCNAMFCYTDFWNLWHSTNALCGHYRFQISWTVALFMIFLQATL